MKIGIDIRSAGGEKTGKGFYTLHITRELLKKDKKNDYFLYADSGVAGFEEFKNAKTIIIEKRGVFWHRAVAKDVLKENMDVFFAPSSFIIPSMLAKASAEKKIKVIITIHDIAAILFPEFHEKKAVILEKLFIKKAIKAATKILAVSENTKKDLIKKFKVPSEKIEVMHCAASADFCPINTTEEKVKELKEKISIPEKFFLTVGTVQPRKNYEALLQAFAMFYEKNKNYHLIIVGNSGWGKSDFSKIIEANYLQKHVHLLGYITSKNLNFLYNTAQAFIFPSLYEGFGIPPLEAMKAGCPIIASNTSSIPEVLGEAAIYCDPRSPAEFAFAMEKIISNEELKADLINKGRIQSKKFNWENSAQVLYNLLETF